MSITSIKTKNKEQKEFQRFSSKEMFFHSTNDPTIQFEMVTLITDVCKQTVGAMARLMRVMRYCNVKLTISCMFKLDNDSLKARLIVSQMSRRARVCQPGEAEFYVLNLGCAAESLVMKCWNGMQLDHMTVDGQTRERIGTIDCQRSSEEVRKEER